MQAQPEAPPVYLIPLIIGVFCVVFPLFWCGVIKVLAMVAGWPKLAAKYPGRPQVPPDAVQGASGKMWGGGQYKHVLIVAPTSEGLFLWVNFLFRAGHAPLLVPWDKVKVAAPKPMFWFGTSTEVSFPELPGFGITLWGKASEAVTKFIAARGEAAGESGGEAAAGGGA